MEITVTEVATAIAVLAKIALKPFTKEDFRSFPGAGDEKGHPLIDELEEGDHVTVVTVATDEDQNITIDISKMDESGEILHTVLLTASRVV